MWELASHRRLRLMSMLRPTQPICGVRGLSEEKRGEKSKRAAKEATQDPRRNAHAESHKTNLLVAKHFANEPCL